MATTEHTGVMTVIDADGNSKLLYPHTKIVAVDGLEEALTEKQNALDAFSNHTNLYLEEGKPAEIDLDDLRTPGVYYLSGSMTINNKPDVVNGWAMVFDGSTDAGNVNYCKQVFFRLGTAGTNDWQTFVRSRTSSGWSEWKKIYTSGDTIPIANGGTGLTSSPSMLTNLASTSAANILSSSPRPGVTGTLPLIHGGTGATSASAARTALGAMASSPSVINMTNSDDYSYNVMRVFSDGNTGYGLQLVIGGGGNTIVGGGESANNLRTELGEVSTEYLYLTADSNVYICSNCNTIDERYTMSLNSTGKLTVPTAIEIASDSDSSNGGYIDFHYAGSTSDYTSRIIENKSGYLHAKSYLANNNKFYLANTSLVKGEVPTSTKYMEIFTTDSQLESSGYAYATSVLGAFGTKVDTDGLTTTYIRAYSNTESSTNYAHLVITKEPDDGAGRVYVTSANVGTTALRNISAGTSSKTAGSSSLSTGNIYLQYE